MTASYTDEPLDSIVQDNIEVDLRIGGLKYLPIELEIELTDGAEGNYVSGKIATPPGHNEKPSAGAPQFSGGEGSSTPAVAVKTGPDLVTIDIDNDLMEERPETSGEIERVWTGIVSNASRIGNGMFEFMSFHPGHHKIQNAAVNIDMSWMEEDFDRLLGEDGNIFMSHSELTGNDNSGRFKRASYIAEEIAKVVTEDIDIPGTDPYEINMEPGGVTVGTAPNGETIKQGKDIKIDTANIKNFKITKGEEGLLRYITNQTNSIWDIRRDGSFYIGAPEPEGHKLRYIVDTSAGKQSPFYLSVQVIGNNIASQKGWLEKDMVNANHESIGKDLIEDAEPYEIKDAREELAQPTFVYRNLAIQTQTEAETVLEKILEEIRGQMGGGEMEVVGHPEVRPRDAVEMPDAKKQPFANERYGVKRVVHRVNNSDGFLTKIEVGGMTKAGSVVFETPSQNIEYEESSLNKPENLFYTHEEMKEMNNSSSGGQEYDFVDVGNSSSSDDGSGGTDDSLNDGPFGD